MTAVLAGVQPPRQAKAFSQEKAHVSLFDHLRGVTKKVERVDVVIQGYSSTAEHSALTRSMQVRLLLPLSETPRCSLMRKINLTHIVFFIYLKNKYF